MTHRAAFQLHRTPLEPGTTLIEASAGTGKTFTISRLFLRLIIERDCSVREILVVTFTEAATEELRDRIRQTLRDAAAYLRTGQTRLPDLADLLAPLRPNAPALLRRLERALTGFDEAPIFTIHGLCQRLLRDRAFESGCFFDLELVPDETPLMQEVADDYWRFTLYGADPVVVGFTLKHGLAPDTLRGWLQSFRRQSGLRILSPVAGRTLPELMSDLVNKFADARQAWEQDASGVRAILATANLWAKGDHAKAELVEQSLAAVQNAFAADGFTPESIDGLEFLAQSALALETKRSKETPQHPFFAACEKLSRAGDHFRIGLRIDFLEKANQELKERKQRHKLQSFDDLLLRLQAALAGPGGSDLIREVRQRYHAALVDEFQDTDPVQYEIFRRLFQDAVPDPAAGPRPGPVPSLSSGASGAQAPMLFLIGDPKQAIYAFRGADIFTYRDAANTIQRGYTLGQNWRSETPLVHAVNTVFARATDPFVFDFIRFRPMVAAGNADEQPLHEGGRRLPALRLWFMPRAGSEKTISQGRAQQILPGVVATEIARLLSGETRLGDRPLTPRDVAVLVPKHRQARLMQEALRALRIPSVLHTEATVFASHEAAELVRVLHALAAPGQDRRLRSAWVTDLLGWTAAQLEGQAAEPGAWQALTERAYGYRDRWVRDGFSAMFRGWLQAEAVRPRLLQFNDGERRLTNLLHLGEVLHQAAHDRQLGPAGLVRWLEEQIASDDHPEEHQLRLERDDDAVRLVTIHKSKGLEYPVVFCPFSWGSSEVKRGQDEEVFCHRDLAGAIPPRSEFLWDLGSDDLDTHRALAIREKLAENLRLLYVALTRARHRCYFVWGALNRAGSAAPTWLFHRPPVLVEPLKDCLEQHFKSLDDATLRRDLDRLVEASKDADGSPTIQVSDLPSATSNPYAPAAEPALELAPRTFTRPIPTDWRISSFSTLTARAGDERPDYDRAPPGGPPLDPTVAPQPEETPAAGIFALPRGSGPGTCLHKIFEAIDFTDPDGATEGEENLERIAERELPARGLGPEWAGVICDSVRRALQVPLETEPGTRDVTLSRIGRGQRLNELEFQFPAAQINTGLLRRGLAEVAAVPDSARHLSRLGFKPARGFVKGYIDLVFEFGGRYHLVDWKSNWLGNRVEDYSPPRLQAVMAENFYVLQYHLYSVALHQYLSRRLPAYDYDRHFGGVFYLFIRGLDPDRPEFGVFRDRPSRERIDSLAKALATDP